MEWVVKVFRMNCRMECVNEATTFSNKSCHDKLNQLLYRYVFFRRKKIQLQQFN